MQDQVQVKLMYSAVVQCGISYRHAATSAKAYETPASALMYSRGSLSVESRALQYRLRKVSELGSRRFAPLMISGVERGQFGGNQRTHEP